MEPSRRNKNKDCFWNFGYKKLRKKRPYSHLITGYCSGRIKEQLFNPTLWQIKIHNPFPVHTLFKRRLFCIHTFWCRWTAAISELSWCLQVGMPKIPPLNLRRSQKHLVLIPLKYKHCLSCFPAYEWGDCDHISHLGKLSWNQYKCNPPWKHRTSKDHFTLFNQIHLKG